MINGLRLTLTVNSPQFHCIVFVFVFVVVNHSLIPTEEVAGVDFGLDVVEHGVVAVGDDGLGLGLERRKVVDDTAAKEGAAIGQRGLVDDDLGSLGLDALHDALDGAVTEVVAACLHREAVDTYNRRLLNV